MKVFTRPQQDPRIGIPERAPSYSVTGHGHIRGEMGKARFGPSGLPLWVSRRRIWRESPAFDRPYPYGFIQTGPDPTQPTPTNSHVPATIRAQRSLLLSGGRHRTRCHRPDLARTPAKFHSSFGRRATQSRMDLSIIGRSTPLDQHEQLEP